MSDAHDMTTLLKAVAQGDARARQTVFELAYAELKRIARSTLKRSGNATVNPTTLIHEAYLKLAQGLEGLNDSTHFYSLFARAMRQVLLDLARSGGTVKHGHGQLRVDLTERLPATDPSLEQLLGVDAALTRLEAVDPELAELVEWHFFGGLSFIDIARLRGVNERTVRRHWELARAVLLESMS